jgi:tetratricopeptide (TPR) repeat protein
MSVKAFLIAAVAPLFCLCLEGAPILTPSEINALYEKANSCLRLTHPGAATASKALNLLAKVIEASEKNHSTEEVLFQSYILSGSLLDVKTDYAEALESWSGALRCLRRHPDWSDSLAFRLYIYAGSDYARLENFDSASSMLRLAGLSADRWPALHDQDRLYDAQGTLSYESGHYLRSQDYFTRALEIARRERPQDSVSFFHIENQLADCLYKLGAYQAALEIYSRLVPRDLPLAPGYTGPRTSLPPGPTVTQFYLNLGRTCIGAGAYSRAEAFFRKADPGELPGVYNDMAHAQLLLGNMDSAFYFLGQWRTGADPLKQTKIDHGINDLYRARALVGRGEHLTALGSLQQAIIRFSGGFKDSGVEANPAGFSPSFAPYRLFEALSYKGRLLEDLYRRNSREESLLDALHAYNSAIALFRYIEKTYTTDAARLFLQQNKREVFEQAVMAAVALGRLHPDGPWLGQAFVTAEQSKALPLSPWLDEMAPGKIPGIDPDLLRQQQVLKYRIARLEWKSDPEEGKDYSPVLAGQKAGYEIELSLLEKNLALSSDLYRLRTEDLCPGIGELQGRLGAGRAIVSLFVSETGLHVFTLSSSSLHYLFIDSLAELTGQIRSWLERQNGQEKGRYSPDQTQDCLLARRLVRPLLGELRGKDEWTLLPDGIFYQLPFESLPLDADQHWLIDKATISYQVSAQFLAEPFSGCLDSTGPVVLSAFGGTIEKIPGGGGYGSAVLSLWKGDGAATAAILHQFHVYLERGYTQSSALREAKLDYIHGNPLSRSPHYWAALILIGNREAITENRSRNWLDLTIVSVLLAIFFVGVLFILRAATSRLKRMSRNQSLPGSPRP